MIELLHVPKNSCRLIPYLMSNHSGPVLLTASLFNTKKETLNIIAAPYKYSLLLLLWLCIRKCSMPFSPATFFSNKYSHQFFASSNLLIWPVCLPWEKELYYYPFEFLNESFLDHPPQNAGQCRLVHRRPRMLRRSMALALRALCAAPKAMPAFAASSHRIRVMCVPLSRHFIVSVDTATW